MSINISTLAQLQAMQDNLAADYVLVNDIDAGATRTWNEVPSYTGRYYGFKPVGYSADFTGTFDGQGYTISNLYINRTTEFGTPDGYNNCGLFGTITTSTAGDFIKDVNILNAEIIGYSNIGILIGVIFLGGAGTLDITNVATSGTVRTTYGSNCGGVVGRATGAANTTFTDCSSSASISKIVTGAIAGKVVAGGFGGILTATLVDCSASGDVSVVSITDMNEQQIGGFVGDLEGGASGCVATGNVTENVPSTVLKQIGGFAGYIAGSSTITLCFAYGNVRSNSIGQGAVGGFVGYATGNDNISKCGAEGDVENSATDSATNKNCSGGFVGLDLSADMTDCYAKGSVCSEGIGHADATLGGFCGNRYTSCTLTNCYSVGAVYSIGTPDNGGGFLGKDTYGTDTNCFWDNETSGWTTTDGDATGKTTVKMKTESTFTNWNFNAIWYLPSYTRAPGLGTTIWLSGVDDYEDFEAGVNDADSFSVTIPTTNKILWIEALESLIAGTGGDEWKIGSNDFGTAITPTNPTIRQQTNYGSKAMQAIKVNESILFVDFVGRKIREMTYSEEHGKHVAPDLSALAEHITYSGITSIAHQKNPDSIIWCTLTDGSLLSMTYERDQNVVAWADHPIDGLVQSVCVIPGSAEDEVWLTIKRTMTSVNSGVFVIYIERMASRTFTDIDDCFFVNSGRTITHKTAQTTIAGLLHLEGETVALLGDGVDLSTYTVSSGIITASVAVTKAQVGLAYTSKLEPMKPTVSTQMGTSAASITAVHEMGVSLLNSAGVTCGASDSALYDIDLDDARWVNLTEIDDLFTGTVTVAIDGGFSLEQPLIISTASPLPCTVRALIPRMDVTGR